MNAAYGRAKLSASPVLPEISSGSNCEELAASICLPLCPRTQTLLNAVGTSHLCQERFWLAVHFLSAGITGSISRDDELMMFKQLVPTLA
jgi:hypothetical protein